MHYWSDKLKLGIDIVDEQHKQIFVQTSKLIRALNTGDAREQAYEAICFLEEYVSKHFRDEEFYFEKLGFPERDNHVKLHRAFQKRLEEIKEMHKRAGITRASANALGEFLFNWWTFHIENVDTKYAELFRKARIQNNL